MITILTNGKEYFDLKEVEEPEFCQLYESTKGSSKYWVRLNYSDCLSLLKKLIKNSIKDYN